MINSNTSGFYQSTGGTPSPGGTTIIEDSTRNNYFAFDLSGLSGTVTGAKLTIFVTDDSQAVAQSARLLIRFEPRDASQARWGNKSATRGAEKKRQSPSRPKSRSAKKRAA